MARGVKANQDAGRGEIRQAPVPARGRPRAVVRGHEGVVRRAEPVRLAGRDGQPDQVQDKVEQDGARGQVKDPLEVSRCTRLSAKLISFS